MSDLRDQRRRARARSRYWTGRRPVVYRGFRLRDHLRDQAADALYWARHDIVRDARKARLGLARARRRLALLLPTPPAHKGPARPLASIGRRAQGAPLAPTPATP